MLDGFVRVKKEKSNGIEEIRWGGTSEDMIWKSPVRNFSSGSNVVVNEWQGAVFYLNGEVSEELPPGQHILETCKTAWGARIIEGILKERLSFTADLFYVNKTEMPLLKFGVGRISFTEYGYTFPVGARGTYSITIENPRKLIEKFNVIQQEEMPDDRKQVFTKKHFELYFLDLICSEVRDVLANTFKRQQVSILERDMEQKKIGEAIKPYVSELFREYGVRLTQFTLDLIKVPEEGETGYEIFQEFLLLVQQERSQNIRLGIERKEGVAQAEIDAQKNLIAARTEAEKNVILGTSHAQERQYDILEKSVEGGTDTENISGSMGSIFQTMTSLGAAGAVAKMAYNQMDGFQNTFREMESNVPKTPDGMSGQAVKTCMHCGQILQENSAFCSNCGTPVPKMDLMICPHCGNKVSRGNFCTYCGSNLKVEKAVCKNCGHQFQERERFCPQCGAGRE